MAAKSALVVLLWFAILHRFFQSETLQERCSGVLRLADERLVERVRLVSIVRRCERGPKLRVRDRCLSRVIVALLLLCAGDVEQNPGPRCAVPMHGM